MYNKLFTKILDSSIWLAPDSQRLVWITLVAAMDEDSIAHFACAENLAARARVTLQETEAALIAFLSPDPNGPDQEFEGRRLERVPGGWFLLNGPKYRNSVTRSVMREQNRERVRRFREKHKKGNALGNVTVMQSDSDSDSDSDSNPSTDLNLVLIPRSPNKPPPASPPAGRAESKKVPRGTRLPEDFELTTARSQFAMSEGLAAQRTFDSFCDYWRSKPGAAGTKLNWEATWRNWCRSEADRIPGRKKRPVEAKTADQLDAEYEATHASH